MGTLNPLDTLKRDMNTSGFDIHKWLYEQLGKFKYTGKQQKSINDNIHKTIENCISTLYSIKRNRRKNTWELPTS